MISSDRLMKKMLSLPQFSCNQGVSCNWRTLEANVTAKRSLSCRVNFVSSRTARKEDTDHDSGSEGGVFSG